MNVSLQVVGPRILVKPKSLESEHQVKDSNIRIALVHNMQAEKEQATTEGIVVSIGPTAFRDDFGDGTEWFKVGDKVFFGKYSGKLICHPEDENDKYIVMNYDDILGIINEVRVE